MLRRNDKQFRPNGGRKFRVGRNYEKGRFNPGVKE